MKVEQVKEVLRQFNRLTNGGAYTVGIGFKSGRVFDKVNAYNPHESGVWQVEIGEHNTPMFVECDEVEAVWLYPEG